jgi:hypothetical protein
MGFHGDEKVREFDRVRALTQDWVGALVLAQGYCPRNPCHRPLPQTPQGESLANDQDQHTL